MIGIPKIKQFVTKSEWQKWKAGLITTLRFRFWSVDDINNIPNDDYVEVEIKEVK